MKNMVLNDLGELSKEELIKERDTCLKEIDDLIKANIALYEKYGSTNNKR